MHEISSFYSLTVSEFIYHTKSYTFWPISNIVIFLQHTSLLIYHTESSTFWPISNIMVFLQHYDSMILACWRYNTILTQHELLELSYLAVIYHEQCEMIN